MSLFKELKRRNVIRVAAAYIVIGWLLLQVASTLTPALHLPAWIVSAIALILILGFVPVILFSWAYELTPEGLKKDSEVDKSNSNTAHTAKKLDVITLIAVAGVVGLVGWQQMNPSEAPNKYAPDDASQPLVANLVNTVSNKSIAVLPFIPLSSDENDAYFGKGIAEELLNALAKFPELKVAARTSAFSFDGKDIDLREVGSKLGVAHVLEGSVRSVGDKVRVTAQLIRAADGFHLWSETYDRDMADIFQVQDEIVQEINRTLQIRLGVGVGTGRAEAKQVNPVSYQNYLRGLELWGLRDDRQKRNDAILAFKLATTQDPNFADGWAAYGLSLILTGTNIDGISPEERIKTSLHALESALKLEPENVRALAGLGAYYYRLELDVERSTDYIKQALDLAPNSAEARYAMHGPLSLTGDLLEVRQTFDQAIALDPLNQTIKRVYAANLGTMGDYDGVNALFKNCVECTEVDQSNMAIALYMAARRNGSDEQVRTSAAQYNTLLNKFREPLQKAWGKTEVQRQHATSTPAFVDSLLGGSSLLESELKALRDLGVDEAYYDYLIPIAQLGEIDYALDLLVQASEISTYGGIQNITQPMGRDVWPDAVRRDPRFHAFWQNPGMPELAELLREKGKTLGLPLPIEGND